MGVKLKCPAVTAVLLVVLVATGCAKAPTEAPNTASDSLEPAAPGAQQPALPSAPPATAATTDETLANTTTPGGQFLTNSLASSFANADPGLKELYDRALVAFQIEDYPRVLTELAELANRPDLTPEQRRAVRELVAKTRKLAPDATATDSAGTSAGEPSPAVFPSAAPASPNDGQEDPFSTAEPAMQRSFARAKAASDIGDYTTARAELKELLSIPQLNWQQKYAIQTLLDKAPAETSAPASTPPEQGTKP